MQDLKLVRVHKDGEHLVVSTSDGQCFRLPIDDALHAALRHDKPGLAQIQSSSSGRVEPRDIQTRIRQGACASALAEETGLSLEYVKRFEGPILAEREYYAELAQAEALRTPRTATSPLLGEQVNARLDAREASPTRVWDAWRETDSLHWIVQVLFNSGGKERQARWRYQVHRHHLEPLNDEARWLSTLETEPAATAAPAPGHYFTPAAPTPPPAATEVAPPPVEIDIDLTDATVAMLDDLNQQRGRRRPLARRRAHITGPATTSEPPTARTTTPEDTPASAPPHTTTAVTRAQRDGAPSRHPAGRALTPDTPPADTSTPSLAVVGKPDRPAGKPARNRGRASIPSWDSVMLSTRKPEDEE